jgi:hypothetical protein
MSIETLNSDINDHLIDIELLIRNYYEGCSLFELFQELENLCTSNGQLDQQLYFDSMQTLQIRLEI